MHILILNRHQEKTQRGAEIFVKELTAQLSIKNRVTVLTGASADSFSKIILGDWDIVIPINGRMQALKASLGRLFKNYKLVISGHSGIGRDDLWNILVRPDMFIALTTKAKHWAESKSLGVKVAQIPNGVDLKRFNPAGEKINFNLPRPIILSVGALVKTKNHHQVIQAVSQLKQGSVLIAGKGMEYDILKKQGEKFLPNRFKIMSFDYDKLPAVYRSADLFTLPSWDREAFGIVYLEAMATGLGIVAPDDDTRREIIGPAGLYFKPGDIDDYARKIEQALTINWQGKALKQVKKFSWQNIGQKYQDLFDQLTKK